MITPQSDIKIINKIRFFNIDLKQDEKEEILNIIEPLNALLESDKINSINLFKDGSHIHGESLINLNGKFKNCRTLGSSTKECLSKLVPKTINHTLMKVG